VDGGDPRQVTRATYDTIPRAFLANTRDRSRGAADLDAFAAALPVGGLALDLGCGPGCDAAELRSRGLRVVDMDLSLAMLRAGAAEFPGPRVQGDLVTLPFGAGCADGVWANACLLHLSPGELGAALREIARVCRPGARAHVSVKIGSGASFESERYGRARWFQYWSPAAFDRALLAAGWSIRSGRETRSKRDAWIVRLASPNGERGAG